MDDKTGARVSGHVAVVTGATRGLGRAIARRLALDGYQIVAVGRSTGERPHRSLPGTLEETEAELVAIGNGCLPLRADLTDADDLGAIVSQTLEWAGRCDVLVNNASYTPAGSFLEVPLSRWVTGYAITVLAPVRLAQGFLPGMIERGSGRILNIGSEAAAYVRSPDDQHRYETGDAPLLYGVTKAALERLTHGLHREFHDRGIAVNNLRAGPMTTEGFHMMHELTGFDTPIEKVHTPDEAAAAAAWMVDQPLDFSGWILDFHDLIDLGVLLRR